LHARRREITDSPDGAEKVTFYRTGEQCSPLRMRFVTE